MAVTVGAVWPSLAAQSEAGAREKAGVRKQVRVIVWGAAITQAYADEIGADGYAPDASVAVRRTQSLLASVRAGE